MAMQTMLSRSPCNVRRSRLALVPRDTRIAGKPPSITVSMAWLTSGGFFSQIARSMSVRRIDAITNGLTPANNLYSSTPST